MLENHVKLYLESLRAANLSRNTIKTYKHALSDFLQFVGPGSNPREIDVQVIRAHIHVLAAKGLSLGSRNHAMRVLKTFGKFLVDERILEENLFELVPRARCPVRLISAPTLEAVAALLDGEIPTTWPARDRVELELLYGTGVRVQEAANIRISDLRADGTILIHGKGDKERLVPIGAPLQRALRVYLRERIVVLRRRKQQTEALFFECKNPRCVKVRRLANLPREPEPINVRTIRRVLLKVCAAKGLEPMHPHLLRHACATHMLNNGAPLVVIKELLGHAKLSTTAQYAFVSPALMQASYRAAHPHARPATLDGHRSQQEAAVGAFVGPDEAAISQAEQ
jgi:site-specific recombinase XerD